MKPDPISAVAACQTAYGLAATIRTHQTAAIAFLEALHEAAARDPLNAEKCFDAADALRVVLGLERMVRVR